MTALAYAEHHDTGVIELVLRTIVRALIWIGLDRLLRHAGAGVIVVLVVVAVALLAMHRRRRRTARFPRSRSRRG